MTMTGGVSSSSSSSTSSCGACKFLRRRCNPGCIFSPYFSYEQAATHFAAAHKVFGASNVSKMLLHLPPHARADAAAMICYEALARVHDPVYGCVAHIFALQQQVAMLKEDIENIERQMAAAAFSAGCGGRQLLSADASVNRAWCSGRELELELEHEGVCLESGDIEKLLDEVREGYCYLY